MQLPSAHRRLLLTSVLCLAASVAYAEGKRPQTPREPQANEKRYEPTEGQAGKDVAWVPTPESLVEKMLDMAKVTSKDFVIDLGAGDGRLVIAAARRGARAHGIEYDADLVALSKRKAARAGVAGRATFIQADIFESDFSKATVVALFLLPLLNLELRPKLLELPPGTRIVSNTFPMGDWQPDDTATLSLDCSTWCCTAYFWIVPARVGGTWSLPQGTLTLTQEYQMLSGTLGSLPVARGRLRGNEITFEAGETVYKGRVDGTTMRGSMTGAQSGTWSATRSRL